MSEELDYKQTEDFLWKLMIQNETIWKMTDNELCHKYSSAFAIFDTLNCINAPNCCKLNGMAYVNWANRVSVQKMIRILYQDAKNEKICRMAICGCAFTPDDIILDIIRNYDDDELHYLAKYNKIHVDAVLEKKEEERMQRLQNQNKN